MKGEAQAIKNGTAKQSRGVKARAESNNHQTKRLCHPQVFIHRDSICPEKTGLEGVQDLLEIARSLLEFEAAAEPFFRNETNP